MSGTSLFRALGAVGLALAFLSAPAPAWAGRAERKFEEGLAHLDEDRLVEAEAAFKEALRFNPDLAEVHYSLSLIYAIQGRTDEARASFGEAERLALQEAQRRESGAPVETGLGDAVMGPSAAQIEALKKAALLEGRQAEASYLLGNIFLRRGQYAEAASSYRESLRLRPDAPGPLMGLGSALFRLGRPGEAAKALRHAVRVSPSSAEARLALGATYGKLGRWDEAAAAFKEALSLKPASDEAFFALGSAYGHLGAWQEALDASREALRLRPYWPPTHYNMGTALGGLGRLEEAARQYQRAAELKPDYAEAHFALGVALAGLGRWQEAKEAYKKAVRLKPASDEARYNLGLAHLNLGDRGGALDEYLFLKELNKKKADTLFEMTFSE